MTHSVKCPYDLAKPADPPTPQFHCRKTSQQCDESAEAWPVYDGERVLAHQWHTASHR